MKPCSSFNNFQSLIMVIIILVSINLSALASKQKGHQRVLLGSLGEYDFIRSDCLYGTIKNQLNQTTVLSPLVAKSTSTAATIASTLASTCPRGNGRWFV